jgi:hypothetical protein
MPSLQVPIGQLGDELGCKRLFFFWSLVSR